MPTPTKQNTMMYAMEPLLSFYESLPADEFSPKKLRVVQCGMIRKGWARTNINNQINRIRQMFKWGVAQELVPVTVSDSLRNLPPLKAGRCDAKESKPVKPVPVELVNATLPYLSSTVRAMVNTQLLTGMRAGELVIMRPCDIAINNKSGAWKYTPLKHKGTFRGKKRLIPIGPKVRAILTPFIQGRSPDAFIFSAAESTRERNLERRAARQSPMTPTHKARRRKQNPANNAGDRYSVITYRRAIDYACIKHARANFSDELKMMDREIAEWRAKFKSDNGTKAKHADMPKVIAEKFEQLQTFRLIFHWHNHQLRHTRATQLTEHAGIEIAQTILGHANLSTTELYAEKNIGSATRTMETIG